MLILALNCYPSYYIVAFDDIQFIYSVGFCSCCLAFERRENLSMPSLEKLDAYLHLDRVKSFMSTYAHKVLAYTTLLNTIYKAKQPSRYLSTRMASKSRGDSER